MTTTDQHQPVDVVRDPATTGVPQEVHDATHRPGTGYLPHRYDLHGIVRICSQVRLPELEYFRSAAVGHCPDIEVHVGRVGPGLRRRARLTSLPGQLAVRYEEHGGRLAANFSVVMGEPIQVVASPLLALSRHVLYTNVIEAVLRFVMVQHGRMLLHSACVDLDGRGLMLSARTDTGKTGTVLRLLREQPARFLSDDMTILEPDGRALCYPKPLTISHHTLRAVDPGDMTALNWRILQIQSRIHSKDGRQFALRLARMNLPILTVNALTQLAIPPPKHQVERLVRTEILPSTQVAAMFVIERGTESLVPLAVDDLLPELIENTDDAYGFPPFEHLAPEIVLNGQDHETLRRREREILGQALTGIRAARMGSSSFDWADRIPPLVREPLIPEPRRPERVIDLRVERDARTVEAFLQSQD